jgi:hypothetical protein
VQDEIGLLVFEVTRGCGCYYKKKDEKTVMHEGLKVEG